MRFATLKLRTLYQVEFANSKKYKFQEEMNMAGTMSEKELRISCGITLGAEVIKKYKCISNGSLR